MIQKTIFFLFVLILISSCKKDNTSIVPPITLGGSSAIYSINKLISELYRKQDTNAHFKLSSEGTNLGLEQFNLKHFDLLGSSKKISKNEFTQGEILEIPIALDGIVIFTSKKNLWLNLITTEELKRIWSKDNKLKFWSDLHKNWPKEKINLYGPSSISGTFSYFTKTINGSEAEIRNDYMVINDNNKLVEIIKNDQYSLSFISYSKIYKLKSTLKSIPISHNGSIAIKPSFKTINNGQYSPLTRFLYVYIYTKNLIQKKELQKFLKFYIQIMPNVLGELGFVQLADHQYKRNLIRAKKYELY